MGKYILKIQTVRELTKQEWAEYKRVYDSHPDTHKIDWSRLERFGRYVDKEKLPTENVKSIYTLEERP